MHRLRIASMLDIAMQQMGKSHFGAGPSNVI